MDMNYKKNIIESIEKRQYSADLNTSRFIIFDIEYGGFGAMVARRKLALQFGEYFNRTVIFNFTNYCYDDPFVQVSNLTFDDLKSEKIYKFNYDINQTDKIVYFDFNDYWNSESRKIYHEKTLYDLSFVEFSGLLLNFIKLKDDYQIIVENSINKFLTKPTIGLHIRRGDKEVESPFIELKIYLNELLNIKEKTGINRVYVSSDSLKAINDIISMSNEFDFIFDDEEYRFDDNVNNINHVLSNTENKIQETKTCIKNIYLLSVCDYIIGQSNVQFAKIAICKMCDLKNRINFYTLINPFSLKKVDWDA